MGHARDAAHRDRAALARRRRRIAPCEQRADPVLAPPPHARRRPEGLLRAGSRRGALPDARQRAGGRERRHARARRGGDGADALLRVRRSVPYRGRRRNVHERGGQLRPPAVAGHGRDGLAARRRARGPPQCELRVGRGRRRPRALGRLFRDARLPDPPPSLRGARRDVRAGRPARAPAVRPRLHAEEEAACRPLRAALPRRSLRGLAGRGRPDRNASGGRMPRGRRGARGGGVRRRPRGGAGAAAGDGGPAVCRDGVGTRDGRRRGRVSRLHGDVSRDVDACGGGGILRRRRLELRGPRPRRRGEDGRSLRRRFAARRRLRDGDGGDEHAPLHARGQPGGDHARRQRRDAAPGDGGGVRGGRDAACRGDERRPGGGGKSVGGMGRRGGALGAPARPSGRDAPHLREAGVYVGAARGRVPRAVRAVRGGPRGRGGDGGGPRRHDAGGRGGGRLPDARRRRARRRGGTNALLGRGARGRAAADGARGACGGRARRHARP